MNKSITVLIERRVKHPMYGKYISRSKRIAAHDRDNAYKLGDTVRIRECRPVSKTKSWEVLKEEEAVSRQRREDGQ